MGTAGDARAPGAVLRRPETWVLLPLRAFLGATFVFAGLQKLADRWFFSPSAPSSIQSQMHRAARASPIGGVVGALSHHAVLVGLVIAFGELAVGLGALLGLWTRAAAVAGMMLSAAFLLVVSWHTRPYYYGPDVVFVFAWTPLAIGGGGPLSLDALIRARVVDTDGALLDRRQFLQRAGLAGWIGTAAVVGGGVAAVIGRTVPLGTRETLIPVAPSASSPRGDEGDRSGAPAGPSGPVALGPASAVPVGGAASFTDPASGDPAFVVQPTAGRFVGFDAGCTHQGCPVELSSGGRFLCPCHGAEFDSATGQVLRGPARAPLRPIAVHEAGGTLYSP